MGSFNRMAVVRRLSEIVDYGTADDVGVYLGDSGDTLNDVSVTFGEIQGPAATETIGRNPIRTDKFTVAVYIKSFVDGDEWEAAYAAEQVLNDIDSTLAQFHRMQNTDLIGNGDATAYAGIQATPRPTAVDGPSPRFMPVSEQQVVPFWGIRFELACTVAHSITT